MAEQPSLVSIIALVLVIVLMFAVLILYIIYFLNRDISSEYGAQWDYVNVSDTATEIRPTGNQILSANGGSQSRGTNPDYLFIGKPQNVPYVKRIFIVFNRSNTNQLELRGDGIDFECDTGGTINVNQLTGMMFFWKNSDTLIPVMVGDTIPN